MPGFRGTTGVGAAARFFAPRLLPFMAPIPGAGPLMFILTAIAAGYALYEALQLVRGRNYGFNMIGKCNAGPNQQISGTDGTTCSSTAWVTPPGPTAPASNASLYTWRHESSSGNPRFWRVEERWQRQAGYTGPVTVNGIWRPFPLHPDRAREIALAKIAPIYAPFDMGIHDEARPRVWPKRYTQDARIAVGLASSQGYGAWYSFPLALPEHITPRRAVPPLLMAKTVTVPQKGQPSQSVVLHPVLPVVRPIPRVFAAVPARPGSKEIKTRAYPIVSYLMHRAVGIPSEVNDFLEALHDALPRHCQRGGKSRKRIRQDAAIKKARGYNAKYKRARNDSFLMARNIMSCVDHMDLSAASRNLVQEHLVDRTFGSMGKALGALSAKSRSPIGIQSMSSKMPGQDRILSQRRKPNVPSIGTTSQSRSLYGQMMTGGGANFMMNK